MFAKSEALAYVRVNFAVELIVGSSKIKQDRIFQQAKEIIEEKQKETLYKVSKPVVIIIDEIDAVGRKSFSPISSNSNEATDNLLINIDKIRQNLGKEVQNLGIGFTLLDIEKSLQYS